MNIGAAVFGVFCLFVVMGGLFYVAGTSSQQAPITDTYGNTQSVQTNSSQNLTTAVTSTGTSTNIWILLIAAAVLLIMAIIAIYAALKALGY